MTKPSVSSRPRWTQRLPGDLRWGMRAGAMAAAVFSAWVTILAISRHSIYLAAAGWTPTIWDMYAFYFGSGLSAGAIIGLLRPWTRHRLGAVLVGIVAAVPFACIIALQGYNIHPHPVTWVDGMLVLVAAVAVGTTAGLVRWSQTYGREPRSQSRHPS